MYGYVGSSDHIPFLSDMISKLKTLLHLSLNFRYGNYEIQFSKFSDGYREEALKTCQCIAHEIIQEKDIHAEKLRNKLMVWFIALLALHDEGTPPEPPSRLLVLIVWTRMQGKNRPLEPSKAFPFCLILINILINYYKPNANYDLEEKCEGEELVKLIGICHKFQDTLSPINLLCYIASYTPLLTSGRYCYSDELRQDMFLISNRCNSQKVLSAVLGRLIRDSITPYSTEIVDRDGNYPLHRAVTALANCRVGSTLVEKLLEVGCYPYSVNKSNLTPFKISNAKSKERITVLERSYIARGLISYPPSLKTLTARKMLYYQERIQSYTKVMDAYLSPSMRNFVYRHSPSKA